MKGVLSRFSNGARSQCIGAAAILALTFGSGVLQAADSPPVLGKSGDVYQVATGTYGDLFPDGSQASADAEVLRLEARRGSGTVEHHVVPGSESDDSDRTPSLFFDATTGRLYVVWSSSNASTLTRINLASFDGGLWSETIEVSGNIYSEKSAPRLAVTHDRFELAGGTAGESSTRTVLHVVWSEDTTDGEKVMYAPVVLVDGELASHVAPGSQAQRLRVPSARRQPVHGRSGNEAAHRADRRRGFRTERGGCRFRRQRHWRLGPARTLHARN